MIEGTCWICGEKMNPNTGVTALEFDKKLGGIVTHPICPVCAARPDLNEMVNRKLKAKALPAKIQMDNFLNMSVADAMKLYLDIFQKDCDNQIQAGDTTYAITNASCIIGFEQAVTFELENLAKTRDEAKTVRTIEVKFREGVY